MGTKETGLEMIAYQEVVVSVDHGLTILRFIRQLIKKKAVALAGTDVVLNDHMLDSSLPKVLELWGKPCSGEDVQRIYAYFGYSPVNVRLALVNNDGKTIVRDSDFNWSVKK